VACLMHRFFLLVTLGVIYLSTASSAFAQTIFDFDEYNTRHGLSQNMVLCMAQDNRRFMWFGTEQGLNRFDGYDFKVYRHRENDADAIVSDMIRALCVDGDELWIGTDNGVCRLNIETQAITHFPVDFTDPSKLNGAYVSAIRKHDDGSIWITYVGSGVDVIYPGRSDILHYTMHQQQDTFRLHNDMISSMVFAPGGYTFLGSYEGIQVIGTNGEVVSPDAAAKIFPWISQIRKTVKSLLISSGGTTLWVGTEVDGLFRINLRTNEVFIFNTDNSDLTSNDILSLYEDRKGNVWIGSDAIYHYDFKRKAIRWFNEYGLYVKNHTLSIFEDRHNNLWTGTARLGVRKFRHQESHLRHFHSNQGEGSITSDEILSFAEDEKGGVWVGSGGAGLWKMKDVHSFSPCAANDKFSSLVIKSIHRDKDGYFVMGTWDGGVIRYHPLTGELDQYHPRNGKFGGHHVWDVVANPDGGYWLGTLRDGLYSFSTETLSSKQYTYVAGDSTALVNNDVISLYLDTRNILWVGTGNGLSVRFPGDTVFQNHFKFKTNDKISLSNNVIHSIHEDSRGRIWLGTKGAGVTVVRVDGRKLVLEKIIRESDGLPGSTVNKILSDHHGHVWLSTNQGLSKIDGADFSVLNLPGGATLKGVEFLPNAGYRDSKGRLYFGSTRGFYVFHPDSIASSENLVDVVFTSLKVINDEIEPGRMYRGRKILDRSIYAVEELRLSHEDYAFNISFAPLEFSGQRDIVYSYFLENLDKEWRFTNSERRLIHYTNLEPGTYVLYVKASIDGTTWPTEAKQLKIVITPPWWSSWWFRVTVLVAVTALIFTLHKVRIRFLERQSAKLERLVELRTGELNRSNQEIQLLLKEVAEQKAQVEEKNKALEENHEEIVSQRDSLESKSRELEKAQTELQKINLRLEDLVRKRTKVLNNTLHELETFLYRASHDLQGPISTLYGLIAVAKLEMTAGPGHDAQRHYGMIQSSVLKLDNTLKKLLHKHAIQRLNIIPEEFDESSLGMLVETIAEEVRDFRREDFTMCVDPDIRITTDKGMLGIMLGGLLENAFAYSKNATNKQVKLFVRRVDNRIVFEVCDFGIGVKSDVKDKIFSMFYRGSELSDGNGLGLYLAKNVAEKLNGEISVDTQENQYATFSISLPAEAPKS
jgi:ligand-binding sensor domain-containing protein/signal transduction histidine kinase